MMNGVHSSSEIFYRIVAISIRVSQSHPWRWFLINVVFHNNAARAKEREVLIGWSWRTLDQYLAINIGAADNLALVIIDAAWAWSRVLVTLYELIWALLQSELNTVADESRSWLGCVCEMIGNLIPFVYHDLLGASCQLRPCCRICFFSTFYYARRIYLSTAEYACIDL